jgi:hypothetical protein
MRAVTPLWCSSFDYLFELTKYDHLLYKGTHVKVKKMAVKRAISSGELVPWSVLRLEPAAQDLQSLLDSDTRLQLFAEGVFRYKGAFYHKAARYGEWTLCLLSAFPWARCLHNWAVLQPENYGLGWQALNGIQGIKAAVLAETRRRRFESLAYLLTTAQATLASGVPLLEGFDETLLRRAAQTGTHTHTHTEGRVRIRTKTEREHTQRGTEGEGERGKRE